MDAPTGLADEQLRTLDRLKGVAGCDGFYLAGGSAVVHHLHHRRSLDLDLFSVSPAVDLEGFKNRIFALFPTARLIGVSEACVTLIVDVVRVDAVRYPYPPIEPLVLGPAGFPTAGLLDLAVMKLAAIARRGIRRDFWDLDAILQSGLGMPRIAEAYCARFSLAEPDLYHVARALTWFADADRDPVFPAGLSPTSWEEIKARIRKVAPTLLLAG